LNFPGFIAEIHIKRQQHKDSKIPAVLAAYMSDTQTIATNKRLAALLSRTRAGRYTTASTGDPGLPRRRKNIRLMLVSFTLLLPTSGLPLLPLLAPIEIPLPLNSAPIELK